MAQVLELQTLTTEATSVEVVFSSLSILAYCH